MRQSRTKTSMEARFDGWIKKKWSKHYLYPMLVRTRQVLYNAKIFFESFYSTGVPGTLGDPAIPSRLTSPFKARFHYNTIENTIIDYLWDSDQSWLSTDVLDVGISTGQWLDFYLDVLHVRTIAAFEIFENSCGFLHNKYEHSETVSVVEGDLDREIDIMFQIVDQRDWGTAVGKLSRHLGPSGVIVVGGQPGWISRNVQIHSTDAFASHATQQKYAKWKELRNTIPGAGLVNKCIRSLAMWKPWLKRVDLRAVCRLKAPQNIILVLAKGQGR